MKDLSKFSGPFMQKSPLYDKASRLRKRAQKRSKRLGETQDYAYEDPKVQKLLSKAKEAEKPKYSLEDDTRVSMSYERPDMPPINYGSPLNEAVIGDLKSRIVDKISDLRSAMESDDVSGIKSATEALQNSLHEVSSRMYGQQQGPYQGAYQGTPPRTLLNMP